MSGQHKHDLQTKLENKPRDEGRSQDHPRNAIGETRMINKGLTQEDRLSPLRSLSKDRSTTSIWHLCQNTGKWKPWIFFF